MSEAELLQANIENLTAFWAACGMTDHPLHGGGLLHASVSWPRRMWFDFGHLPDRRDLEELLERAKVAAGPVMIPQWHANDEVVGEVLVEAGFEIGMTQEAMVASRGVIETHADGARRLRRVTDARSTTQWTRVASDSFGYPIDESVIAGLVGVHGFHLVLADVDDTVVGTGMLWQTDRIAGLHMVGVPPAHRRRGHAREIMLALLALARDLDCEYATLQASAAGEPLYEQLGFKAQGPIRSYRRTWL